MPLTSFPTWTNTSCHPPRSHLPPSHDFLSVFLPCACSCANLFSTTPLLKFPFFVFSHPSFRTFPYPSNVDLNQILNPILAPPSPQAQRYILSFTAGPPFIIDGVEHVRLTVVGQSFMLHQIRKMVGLVLAVARNVISEEVIDYALRK